MNQLVSLLLYYLPIIHTALSISLSSLAHPVFSYSCFRLLSVTSKNQIEKQNFSSQQQNSPLTLAIVGEAPPQTHYFFWLVVDRSHLYTLLGDSFLYRAALLAALPAPFLLQTARFPHFTHSSSFLRYILFTLLFLCLAHGSTSSRRFYDCAAALASICFGNSSKRALIEGLRSRTNLQALGSSLKIPIPAGTAGTVHSTRRELPKICTPDRFARHGVVLSEVF